VDDVDDANLEFAEVQGCQIDIGKDDRIWYSFKFKKESMENLKGTGI